MSYSIATVGCNFRCRFCQNADIAQMPADHSGMIMGETSLSFLGIGLRSPTISWGVMLKEAQSLQVVVTAPWLMLPGVFVVIAVLAFNLLGDGLRDATDPYGGR